MVVSHYHIYDVVVRTTMSSVTITDGNAHDTTPTVLYPSTGWYNYVVPTAQDASLIHCACTVYLASILR